MSLHLGPSAAHRTSTTNLTARHASTTPGNSSSNANSAGPRGAPSAPGLPDTLRQPLHDELARLAIAANPTAIDTSSSDVVAATTTSTHPLEARLAGWRAAQHTLKMEGLRRVYGAAEPVRRGMELKVVRGGEWRAAVLGGSAGVSGDVLEGRDCVVDWEDIYGGESLHEGVDFHSEVEAKLKMDW